MTLGEAYRQGKKLLEKAGNEAPAFDAGCLFRKAFGLDRQQRIVQSGSAADMGKTAEYLAMAKERAGGRPLQYILGEWPFMGFPLEVGEGVLVPREETELLVRTAAELLAGAARPEIADLCAGTGAVSIGLASLLPGARITAVEKYPAAFFYLRRNLLRTNASGVTTAELDVLSPEAVRKFLLLDAVVSNPPYVRADEIPGLQEEVQREPREALDGGRDGLVFYRAIARLWLPRLKPGGTAAVEIGEDQAADVVHLFSPLLRDIRVTKDFNGLDRVVSGKREE